MIHAATANNFDVFDKNLRSSLCFDGDNITINVQNEFIGTQLERWMRNCEINEIIAPRFVGFVINIDNNIDNIAVNAKSINNNLSDKISNHLIRHLIPLRQNHFNLTQNLRHFSKVFKSFVLTQVLVSQKSISSTNVLTN